MRRLLLAGLALLIVASFVLLAGYGSPVSAGEMATVDPEKAKALFVETHKCNMCHSVPAAEIEAKTKSEKMKGADLGGKIDVEFAALAAYVRKEGELDGKTHTKPFKGSDEELQAIIDWLGSLEAQE